MKRFPFSRKIGANSAFTLIEILVVMGMIALLSAVTVIALIRPQATASVDADVATLVAELRRQQLLAMSGENSDGELEAQGMYFTSQSYITFSGNTYAESDPGNFVSPVAPEVSITTNLPNANIIFEPLSGEVVNFSATENSITVSHSSGVSKTLTINRLGVVSVE